MPRTSPLSPRARRRAAVLVLILPVLIVVVVATGAAGAAVAAKPSSETSTAAPDRHARSRTSAVPDDPDFEELTARAAIARRQIAIAKLKKQAVEQAALAAAQADNLRAQAEVLRAQEAEALRAQVEATRAQQAAAASRRVAMWDRLAACETDGDWHDGGDYGGGLGIYIGTWKAYGGQEFAPRPQLATKDQQIIVAERIAQDGFGGWGCAEAVGLPT